jgi:outer membrane murein-binding lipoprotein Lpp
MRKLTSSLVGTSLLAVALSVVAVGVVWAGSSARQFLVNDSTETTVPTEGEIPDLIPDDSLPPSEVLELINELTATVAELEEKVDAYESDIQAARSDAAKARAAADAAVADTATATAAANDAKARVAQFEKRLSKLNDEGVYTGTVTPAQLSRRLAPADINGDWPLDRTNGELNGDKVKVSGSNCWSDYRYNIFVVPETFRGLTCFRVLK